MENLLNCHGMGYSAKIEGVQVEGKITVDGYYAYLCQNYKNGQNCRDKQGYGFSWCVREGTGTNLKNNIVTEFKLLNIDQKNYKDWQVGDKVIDDEGEEEFIVIFRSGELVVLKTKNNKATASYTCKELFNSGFRLVSEEPVEEIVHLTIQDISDGKGKGIPTHLIRIKK